MIPDPFAKRAMLVLPVVVVAALVKANIDEIRAYAEYTPLVLPGALLVFQNICREPARPAVTAP